MWDTLIIKPLSALLLLLYNVFFQNYGLAIIMFCLVTKILLLYFSARGKYSMLRQTRLAPKQKELERIHGKDKMKYQESIQKLYQEEGVNPMGGCLWNLLPFPIFIALYTVIREPLKNLMGLLPDEIARVAEILGVEMTQQNNYFVQLTIAEKLHDQFGFVTSQLPAEIAGKLMDINFNFFPGFNLAPIPNLPWQGGWNWLLLIPFLSAGSQMLAMIIGQKLNPPQQPAQGQGAGIMKNMIYMMPLMSVWIGFTTPAAMGIYWTASALFGIVQDVYLTKYYNKKLDAEEAHKSDLAARRKAAEEQMKEEERLRKLESGEDSTKNTSRKKKYRMKNTPSGGRKE